MKLRYSKIKSISSTQLLDLYKSVEWLEKKDRLTKGKSISNKYRNSQVVISAWYNKELVGVIEGLTDKTRNGAIFGLAVKKPYQWQGIGTNLIKLCINQHPQVKWFVEADNKDLNKFYKKLGFKEEKKTWFCFKK